MVAPVLPMSLRAARGPRFTQGYKMSISGRRTVVFDLDGTLADTSADLLAAANACFRGMGHGDLLGPDDTLTAFHGGRAMLRLGFSRVGAVEEAAVDANYPVLLRAYEAAIDVHTRLYPGAVQAVEALKSAGFAVSICTNKPAGLAETLTRRLGIGICSAR